MREYSSSSKDNLGKTGVARGLGATKPVVRLFLTIATIKDYDIHQLDIKAAFLHANLREEIYMAVSEGITEDPRKVYKLKKSLYGL